VFYKMSKPTIGPTQCHIPRAPGLLPGSKATEAWS